MEGASQSTIMAAQERANCIGEGPQTGFCESTTVENSLNRIASFLSRWSYLVAFGWLGVVTLSLAGLARNSMLAGDDILFRWVVMLPSVRDIEQALKVGVIIDPPLGHFITHVLVSLFGAGPLVVRLSSICGIAAMLLSIFLILRRHIEPCYALLGLLLPFCTTLVSYGYYARPYALLWGFLGIAVYFWDRCAQEGAVRVWWNIGFGMALAAALGCHFYAVLAIPAFCLGEVMRIQRRRQICWPTLFAILVASATEFFYWPIIKDARKLSGHYFGRPQIGSIGAMLNSNLAHLAGPLFLFLLLAAAAVTLNVHVVREFKAPADSGFRELSALALGFLLIPVLGWIAGYIVLRAFVDRYVLHGMLGLFILIPLFAAHVLKQNRVAALALLLSCGIPAVHFVTHGFVTGLRPPDPLESSTYGGPRRVDLALLEAALPKLPGDIAVSDHTVYVALVNDSPALKAKCVLIFDRGVELEYTGQDTVSVWAKSAAQLGLVRAEAWRDFDADGKPFLFLTTPDGASDGYGWLRAMLEAENRYGRVVMKVGRYLVVEAKSKSADGEP
jgi:hypothetical protein